MTLTSKRTTLPRLSALFSAIILMSGLTSPVLAQAETIPTASKNSGGGGASGNSKGQIANELLNCIKSKWNPDQKFVGTKITAYITVDENGNVLTVTTNAQNKALDDSFIAAIRQASPLTPIAGLGYAKLELTFVVSKK